MLEEDVLSIQIAYPQVWHACHRHVPPTAELTTREATLLAHLAEDALQRPRRLAEHLSIGASTLSEALNRLVERGLVERRRHGADGRRIDFVLTASGRAVVGSGSPLDPQRLGAALSRLAEAEREQAVTGLRLLARACRELSDRTDGVKAENR